MRKTLLTILISLNGFIAFSQCTPNVTDSLIAYWCFSGNANICGGSAPNGTVSGATLTTDSCGNANSAYLFGGGSNRIEIPNYSPLSFHNTDFTISAWTYQPHPATVNNAIISKRNGFGLNNGYLFWISSAQQVRFSIAGGGTGSVGVSSVATIDTNKWNHVLITYSYATQTMKFYLNGIYESETDSIPSPTATSSGIVIGNDFNFSINYQFSGKLDEIRMYNRALDSCDVDSLYRMPCSLTGINENSIASNIKIFPNPNNGNFVISVSDYNLESVNLTITNLIGQKLQESKLTFGRNEINLKQPSGVYFLTVSNKSGKYTTKIIVQ